MQIGARHFSLAAEHHHAVPFRFLLKLPLAVFVAAGRRERDGADGGVAVSGVADFRITAEVADQNDLIDGSHSKKISFNQILNVHCFTGAVRLGHLHAAGGENPDEEGCKAEKENCLMPPAFGEPTA